MLKLLTLVLLAFVAADRAEHWTFTWQSRFAIWRTL